MVDRIEYRTIVNGTEHYRGHELESAIRSWDGNTYNFTGDLLTGAITVQAWDSNGVMVRDGNVLHVRDGRVYLSPRLIEA